MCGIVGVLGNHEAAPLLVDALKRLEYRGYDSAGIATVRDGHLERRRAVGKLVNLSDLLVHEPLAGKSGIGHTRWATHGAPNVANAHPHKAGKVAVVHNGIIENFKDLRDQLDAKGADFRTETDTETIVQLCMSFMDEGDSPLEAAKKTIAALEGAFALCFLFAGEDDLLIAARKGSPLAIGHGDGEMFVGSDAIALAPMTTKITYLDEGDWAVISRSGAEIFDAENKQVSREMQEIALSSGAVEKGHYKHFMAKEIAEQPSVIADALSIYLNADRTGIDLPTLDIDLSKFTRVTIVACGTAYLAGAVAKYWFEQIAGIPVEVDIASEYRYRQPVLDPKTLAVFVSQSGETADTLAALRHCKEGGMKTLGIVNVETSTIAREADAKLLIHAGTEIGVASTKAFTCQLLTILSLCIRMARLKGALDDNSEPKLVKDLVSLPGRMTDTLALEPEIDQIAGEIAKAKDALFLGRGPIYPLALEGALKLKEISYIHAEGYASGELKHGPIALVDEHMPVIVLAPKDALYDKTVSNMQEVMARGGKVLLITDKAGAKDAGDDVWRTIVMPDIADVLAPILYALPAQMLAYHTAVHKGTDVDQPRNLAKSVTVE